MTIYRYMHDMHNGCIRAYGDTEYGDIHEIRVPHGCMTGVFNEVCVVSDAQGTWIIRHRENGDMYFEDCRGVDDPAQVDVSPIITDARH